MRKYKVKKIKGIRIAEPIRKEKDRPAFPRPAVFADKKKYNRKKYNISREEEG